MTTAILASQKEALRRLECHLIAVFSGTVSKDDADFLQETAAGKLLMEYSLSAERCWHRSAVAVPQAAPAMLPACCADVHGALQGGAVQRVGA